MAEFIADRQSVGCSAIHINDLKIRLGQFSNAFAEQSLTSNQRNGVSSYQSLIKPSVLLQLNLAKDGRAKFFAEWLQSLPATTTVLPKS